MLSLLPYDNQMFNLQDFLISYFLSSKKTLKTEKLGPAVSPGPARRLEPSQNFPSLLISSHDFQCEIFLEIIDMKTDMGQRLTSVLPRCILILCHWHVYHIVSIVCLKLKWYFQQSFSKSLNVSRTLNFQQVFPFLCKMLKSYGFVLSFRKAGIRYFLRSFWFSPNDSPSKNMKDVFYFI